jgi:hypothetical protein
VLGKRDVSEFTLLQLKSRTREVKILKPTTVGGTVVPTYNSSYSRGRHLEESKPSQGQRGISFPSQKSSGVLSLLYDGGTMREDWEPYSWVRK